MLFSSISFLFYFLPIVLIIYFCVPDKWKNMVLFCCSLFFYAWGEPKNVWLMVISIAMGYLFGIFMERYRGTKISKAILAISIGFFVVILGFYKYSDFFIENINRFTGSKLSLWNIAIPIGISFDIFQMISYIVDVYRGTVKAQKNIINLGTYIAMFPQLIAGPIVRYCDIEKFLKERTYNWEQTADGIERFLVGLTKKVILANVLGELCELYRGSDDISVLYAWMYAIAFMLQIYYDFSGYSDMAIGLGKILGFYFPENFRYPYCSRSLKEFWRCWHISLGTWFRDYVYIPMGGNRVSKGRWYVNILVVWFLTGFWHGADWNFIIWGLFFAVFLIWEKHGLKTFLEEHRVFSHVYVLIVVMFSFVIFGADSMTQMIRDMQFLFGMNEIPLYSREALYYLKSYAITFLLGIVCAMPFLEKLREKMKGYSVLRTCMWIGLLIINTAFLAAGSFNPFLYFRF